MHKDAKLRESSGVRCNKSYIFLSSNACYIANLSEHGHGRTYEYADGHVHGIGAPKKIANTTKETKQEEKKANQGKRKS